MHVLAHTGIVDLFFKPQCMVYNTVVLVDKVSIVGCVLLTIVIELADFHLKFIHFVGEDQVGSPNFFIFLDSSLIEVIFIVHKLEIVSSNIEEVLNLFQSSIEDLTL